MTNPHPYRIRPDQRGHRKRVGGEEPTRKYSIALPASICAAMLRIGAIRVRAWLRRLAEDPET